MVELDHDWWCPEGSDCRCFDEHGNRRTLPDPNDPTQLALTVECPFCDAHPGRPCTMTVGVRTGKPLVVADTPRSHLERRQAAGLADPSRPKET